MGRAEASKSSAFTHLSFAKSKSGPALPRHIVLGSPSRWAALPGRSRGRATYAVVLSWPAAPARAKTQMKTVRAPLCMAICARRRAAKANGTPRASRVTLNVLTGRRDAPDAVKRSKLVVRRVDLPASDVGDGWFWAPTVRRHMQLWCSSLWRGRSHWPYDGACDGFWAGVANCVPSHTPESAATAPVKVN